MNRAKALSLVLILSILLLLHLLLFLPATQAQVNGTIVWGNNTPGFLKTATYTQGPPSGTGSVRQTGKSYNITATSASAIQFAVIKAAPTRNEYLAGHQKADGRLDIFQCRRNCNEIDDWKLIGTFADAQTSANATRQAFDIAYEEISGRALVVFANNAVGNTPNRAYYCIWDGYRWSPAPNCDMTFTANEGNQIVWGNGGGMGVPQWINLKARNDEILLGVSGTRGFSLGLWNATNWSQTANFTPSSGTPLATLSAPAFGIAWENISGQAMAVWDTTAADGTTFFSLLNESPKVRAWNSSSTAGPDTGSDTNNFITLARDPSTDRISMAISDSGADAHIYIWRSTLTTSGFTASGSDPIDISTENAGGLVVTTTWNRSGSSALFSWTDSADLEQDVVCWTTAGFGSVIADVGVTASDDVDQRITFPSPAEGTSFMFMGDILDDLYAQVWNGSGCGNGSFSAVIGTTGVKATVATSLSTTTDNSAPRPFFFDYQHSFGDDDIPRIEIIAPENNTIETTITPTFSFNFTDGLFNQTYGNCTLWLQNGSSTGAYGFNHTVFDTQNTPIIPNSSMNNAPYTWWINCSDGINNNVSAHRNITIDFSPDIALPYINLIAPVNMTINTTSGRPEFFFNATDEQASTLDCTLWITNGETMAYGRNESVNATFNARYTFITANATLENGAYRWNVSCFDGTNYNVSEDRNITINTRRCGLLNNATPNGNDGQPQNKMAHNLFANETCFTIGASNITLDCDNWQINYSVTGSTVGSFAMAINNSGSYPNVTVKNCNIIEVNASQENFSAIYLFNAKNSTIFNNTIFTWGVQTVGINLTNSSGANLSENRIFVSGITGSGIGIINTNRTMVSSGNITVNGSSTILVVISGNSWFNTFYSNKLTARSNNAITIRTGQNNNFSNNNMSFSTANAGNIIPLTVSNNNIFEENNITTTATSDLILIRTANNTIRSNKISTSSSAVILIHIDVGAGKNTQVISNDLFSTAGGGWSLITINNAGGGNTVIGNNLTTYNPGTIPITVGRSAPTEYTIIAYNNINSTSTGIFIGSGSNNTNITGNNITAINGYGIWIDRGSGDNATLYNNNISDSLYFEIMDNSSEVGWVNKTLQYGNSFGDIRWISNYTSRSFMGNITINVTNEQGIGLNRNTFFGSNVVAVNVSAFSTAASQSTVMPRINSSAQITIIYPGASSANQILYVSNYTTTAAEIFQSGTNCIGTTCSLAGFNTVEDSVTFNTSGLGSFTANFTNTCGDITTNVNLQHKLRAGKTCFTILANHITLNCIGYGIEYGRDGSTEGFAINNSGGYDNITIKNCVINETSGSHDIFFNNAENNTIVNNTIWYQSLENGIFGIYLNGSSATHSNESARNNITGNNFTTGGWWSNGIYSTGYANSIVSNKFYGVIHPVIFNNSINNLIFSNDFYPLLSIGGGIYLYSGSANNNISKNNISTYLSGSFMNAIDIVDSANNTIRENNLTDGVGPIAFFYVVNSPNTTLESNTIGPTSMNFNVIAALFLNSSPGSTINSNSFNVQFQFNRKPVITINNSANVTFTNNNITWTLTCCSASGAGLILGNSPQTYIFANNFNASLQPGGGTNFVQIGIFVDSTNDSIISSNNISVYGYDIVIEGYSGNNLFINNTLNGLLNSPFEEILSLAIAGKQLDTNYPAQNSFAYQNKFGKIAWINNETAGAMGSQSFVSNLTLNVTNLLGFGLDNNLFIGNNTFAINTSAFSTEASLSTLKARINSTANITFYGINLTSVNVINKLWNYTTDMMDIQRLGSNCISDGCTNISYIDNTFIFNVTSLSSYAANYSIFGGGAPENSRPTAPLTLIPVNGSSITNRTPTFTWVNSTDADSDIISYHLQVDDNQLFNNPEINISAIQGTIPGQADTSYFSSAGSVELAVDTQYFWRVRANDSGGFGGWSDSATLPDWANGDNHSNFTVNSLLSFTFTNAIVQFGTIDNGQNVSTFGGDAAGNQNPIRAQNTGNIEMNVSINASPLFTEVSMNQSYFQFKITANESNSFYSPLSATAWTNMSRDAVGMMIPPLFHVVNLSWRNVKNDFLLDLNLSVPFNETAGGKDTNITFFITGYVS